MVALAADKLEIQWLQEVCFSIEEYLDTITQEAAVHAQFILQPQYTANFQNILNTHVIQSMITGYSEVGVATSNTVAIDRMYLFRPVLVYCCHILWVGCRAKASVSYNYSSPIVTVSHTL